MTRMVEAGTRTTSPSVMGTSAARPSRTASRSTVKERSSPGPSVRFTAAWRRSEANISPPAAAIAPLNVSPRVTGYEPGFWTQPSTRTLPAGETVMRSEEHTSELQSLAYLVCRLLLEKKKKKNNNRPQVHTPEVQSQIYMLDRIYFDKSKSTPSEHYITNTEVDCKNDAVTRPTSTQIEYL